MADRPWRALALVLALAVMAAACSGDDAEPEDAVEPGDDGSASVVDEADDDASDDDADDDSDDESDDDADDDSDDESDDDADDADDDERGSDYLFDQSQFHTFELTIADDDLAFLDDDPTAEEYVPATLTFEGETLEVGVRYKGSVGAFVGCLDGPNPLIPSGAKACTKLSMKIKINWNDSDDEFLGVRKIQLHSMNLDPSLMHERLGYWLMREMGVAAPRSTHAQVMINGEFAGVFALTENIDGRFTRANFDDGTGNLYKEVWPFTEEGEVTSDAVLVDGLRTNENDPNVNALIIRRFATDVLDADDPGEQIARWMDLETTMNHLAVDRTIRHDDGPFHWYCDVPAGAGGNLGGCANHNYFIYEDPTEGRITLVPWDFDNAFDNIIEPSNPITPVADGLGETTADCAPFPFGDFGIPQRSASCDPLFAAWASLDDEYAAAVQRLHDGPLRAEVIDPLLDEWTAQIKDAVIAAEATHDDALSTEAWDWALDRLRGQLDHARANPVG